LAQKRPQHSTDLRKAANIIRAISKKWNKLEEQLIADCRNNIMGVEENIARIYWSAIGKALPESFGFDLLKWLHTNIQKGNPQKIV
jgi:CRISPR/Cas system-associated endonuclease Cas1